MFHPLTLSPRVMRYSLPKLLFPLAVFVLLSAPALAAEVKNARAEREGDAMVFIYDLQGGEAEETVALTVSIGGKIYTGKTLHVAGDIGRVKTGKERQARWKITEDFPHGLSDEPGWQIYVPGKTFRDPATGMDFVFVKGGCFSMGDAFGKGNRDELPLHEVCVSDFYLGKYEVTQGEWQKVMGNNPSSSKACGDRCPVDSVSWRDADDFVKKLGKQSGRNYRLPREAEWEYAARSGGKKERWAGTNREKELKNYALFAVSGESRTRPVGRKKSNSLGLHDMSGSVWEWVADYYDGGFYGKSPRLDPTGSENGLSRVQRGGSWRDQPDDLRVTRRVRGKEGTRSTNVGFRVAFPAE